MRLVCVRVAGSALLAGRGILVVSWCGVRRRRWRLTGILDDTWYVRTESLMILRNC